VLAKHNVDNALIPIQLIKIKNVNVNLLFIMWVIYV